MTARALRLALLAAVLAIGATYFIVARRPPEEHAGRHVTISGNYSEDWMKMCGPVQGSAQNNCTADLDAAYGRAAGKPVPADTKEGSSDAKAPGAKE